MVLLQSELSEVVAQLLALLQDLQGVTWLKAALAAVQEPQKPTSRGGSRE